MSTKKHPIYVIQEGAQGESYWNRAGVAFLNKDGSFTFRVESRNPRFSFAWSFAAKTAF